MAVTWLKFGGLTADSDDNILIGQHFSNVMSKIARRQVKSPTGQLAHTKTQLDDVMSSRQIPKCRGLADSDDV